MKSFLHTLLLTLAFAGAAPAETLVFPSDAPVASVTVPDTWTATETDTGMQANSPEDAIVFYLDVSTVEDREAAAKEAFTFLAANGVTIDTTKDDASNGAINGMPVYVHNFDGTDANGPVTIGLYIIQTAPKTVLVATYWGTKGEQDKFADDMKSIMQSLKPVGS